MNTTGPARSEQIGQREVQQQVAQRGRVENTGIIDRDKARHESVSQVQLLGLPGQLVQGLPAADSRTFPIGKQVLEQDATMRSDFAVRQFVHLQKAHQVRTRHVEKVSRLLRRQFSVDWNDRDGVALRHLRQDIDEHAQRRDRDLDLLVAVDEAQSGRLAAADARREESTALPGDLCLMLCGERRRRSWGAQGGTGHGRFPSVQGCTRIIAINTINETSETKMELDALQQTPVWIDDVLLWKPIVNE